MFSQVKMTYNFAFYVHFSQITLTFMLSQYIYFNGDTIMVHICPYEASVTFPQ